MAMPDDNTRVAELLHEAGETHHVVYRIVDGDDPDWASWYADWLTEHSELPEILGAKPVRSHLVYELDPDGRQLRVVPVIEIHQEQRATDGVGDRQAGRQGIRDFPTAIGAKTAGYYGKQGKGFDRFYLAVPARGGQSAEVRIYTVQD